MESVFRLDSVSPTLAESFRRASSAKRRQAAVVACELAASSADLAGQEVGLGLAALRGGAAGQPDLRQRLEDLAAHFDDEYLRLNEEVDESRKAETLRLFSKARAASALAFALIHEPGELHEAIYEAIAALDDPSELIRVVESELR
ncbi:hypothetical protein [Sorangium sp. So ce176]|uniref:hypothetical protein n=1 Tax=Sorangium sp. So ce176 TaxID=3133286 RepID=UPI003F62F980